MVDKDSQIVTDSVRELSFDQPVANIGCHADNDITVTGEGVLPFHAMVVLQDDVFQFMFLHLKISVSR